MIRRRTPPFVVTVWPLGIETPAWMRVPMGLLATAVGVFLLFVRRDAGSSRTATTT